MTRPDRFETIGFVGGTGPQGRGLALRWARAGHAVLVGSRSREKAEDVVAGLAGRVGEGAELLPATNEEAVERAEVVVVTVPYEAQAATLPPLRAAVDGKVVVNVVNPMAFDEQGPKAVPVAAGSAAEECAEIWPEGRVVSAFHDVPARRLLRVQESVECDVLICSDHPNAAHQVAHLAARIPGMWGVYCGPLRNSAHLENMTPVLLFVNRTYGVHAGIKIDGVERDDASLHAKPAGQGTGW
ncbi:MAG: NADPH-dependent F420 reductase [Nitriliruptorales bacterium]